MTGATKQKRPIMMDETHAATEERTSCQMPGREDEP